MEDRRTLTVEIADGDAASIACSAEQLLAQRRRLQDIEADLTSKIDLVLGELSENDERTAEQRASLALQADDLAARTATFESSLAELEARRADLQRDAAALESRAAALGVESAGLAERSAKLTELEAQLNRRHLDIEKTAGELHKRISAADVAERDRTAALDRIANDRASLEETRQRLEADRDRLAEERAKIKSQRKSIAQQLKSQRAEQLAEIEIQRAELARRAEQLEAQATEIARESTVLGAAGAEVAARDQTIAQLKQELAERTARQEQLKTQIHDLQDQVASNTSNDKNASQLLADLRAEHAAAIEANAAELIKVSAKLAEKVSQFDARSGEFAAQAKQLGEKTATLQAREKELIGQAAQLEKAETQLRQLTRQADEHTQKIAERDARLNDLESNLSRQAQELETLTHENVRLQHELKQAGTATTNDPALLVELELLRQQRTELEAAANAAKLQVDELQHALIDAKERLEHAPSSAQNDDLQRRFEMSMHDLREQKARNAELEEKLAQARRATPIASSVPSSGFDWEAQKRRMMEAEYDEGNIEAKRERLTIEDTIRITDEALAHKDDEIAELKQLLDNQSSNIGAVAVGAAAIAQMLDQDELVNQERERLKFAQDEWREKLRVAEVELSMERAKLARERMLLDEKIQQLQRAQANGEAAANDGDEKDANGKNKRRWLSRLGIRDTDGGR